MNLLNQALMKWIKENNLHKESEVVKVLCKTPSANGNMPIVDRVDWSYNYVDHGHAQEIRAKDITVEMKEDDESVENATYIGHWTGVFKNTAPVINGRGFLV